MPKRKPCKCVICAGMTKIICVGCSKEVQVKTVKVKYRNQKYCSRICAQKNIIRPPKKVKETKFCGCGCGVKCKSPTSTYRPGHNPPINHRAPKGSDNHFWKGGVTKRPHYSYAHKKFRKSVYERDDYTCQDCGKKGVELNAHHIIPVSVDISKSSDIDNGKTLCLQCHLNVHKEMKLWKR
jgi:5-methylcytosine-specific restriction endonuclease McrA